MYTKEQLIKAQFEYNKNFVANPDEYQKETDYSDPATAERQVEHLLTFIEE